MSKKKKSQHNKNSEFIIYKATDGSEQIQVRLEEGTVWLSQALIAKLFQKAVSTISEHISNIYSEGELSKERTFRKFRKVQREEQRKVERSIDYYNLEVIIAVGYRVKSHVGTQFRRWATKRINEYLIKGFTMDDERLKSGHTLGDDYFDELIERIKDIRSSERRFYQKIKDIYSLAIDYDPKFKETKRFFKTVQNKLHWAITGQTSAEIIKKRVSSKKKNLGLTSWSGKMIRKKDVTIAKNYLKEDELSNLNHIVTMYLDYAELQAKNREPMTMKDWSNKLDSFLKFNEKDILKSSGRVSENIAKELAYKEYKKFNKKRQELEPSIKELKQIMVKEKNTKKSLKKEQKEKMKFKFNPNQEFQLE